MPKCVPFLLTANTLGYIRLAFYYWVNAFFGYMRPNLALPKAKSAVLQALKLDDTRAEAHGILGILLGLGEFDWRGAECEARRALELDPGSAEVHYYAYIRLYATGRLDEALTEIRLALEQDPLSPQFNLHLGIILHATRQHDRAIKQQRFAIELDPNYITAYESHTHAYLYRGLHEEAISTAEKAMAISGRSLFFIYPLGISYAYAGRTAEARQLLEELKERSRGTHVSPFAIGMIQLALGQLDEGFDQLMRAIDERDLKAIWDIKSDPFFDPLRSHPRYHALLRKMNLEPWSAPCSLVSLLNCRFNHEIQYQKGGNKQ